MELTEDIKILLKTCLDSIDSEDTSVRERQIRIWRQQKLLWEGFSRMYWSATARDWRVYDDQAQLSDNQAAYYDKPINVYRAYLESIIAALSVTVPPIVCFPDDADNPLDIETAKAGDKAAKLIFRHNDAELLWLHALFIFCTEGMVAAYSYPKEDEAYGTYEKNEYKDEEELQYLCPHCQEKLNASLFAQPEQGQEDPNSDPEGEILNFAEITTAMQQDKFMPGDEDVLINDQINQGMLICPECKAELDPGQEQEKVTIRRLVGVTNQPKTRQCIEVHGGLFVKIPNYAQSQKDIPYLQYMYETHYSNVLERYPELWTKRPGGGQAINQGPDDPYEQWGRLNPQYRGEYPRDNVTVKNSWIRPAYFNVLSTKEEAAKLKHLFPNGVKVVSVNDDIVDAENECLDDCWTLTHNPLSDYLHHDPLGLLLVSIQDITNTLVSLTLQTIEHGIPQTFASPAVLDFGKYSQVESQPGNIVGTKAAFNKPIGDGFYQMSTANLSPDVMPFGEKIQQMGQLVSGALPSLFGGQIEGSNTASEYSMSKAQALQRLQNTWKMLTIWWKTVFGKAIPSYLNCLEEDERFVQQIDKNNFENVFIRKAEAQGKIGNVELEANDQLPITWAQQRDIIMKLLETQNPEILAALGDPENLPTLKRAIGLDQFKIPGEDDRQKQYEEIQELLLGQPIMTPVDPMMVMQAQVNGVPPPQPEQPSVAVDPDIDNHEIEFNICRGWLISSAGRLAKIENPGGYRNVLLHMKAHQMFMQMAMQQQMASEEESPDGSNPEKPKGDKFVKDDGNGPKQQP